MQVVTSLHTGRPRVVRQLILGLALSAVTAVPGFAQVEWRSGDKLPPRKLQPDELVQELERLSQREERRHAVVHLRGPSSEEQREALAAGGLRLLSFLGGDAYFASLSPAIDTARVLNEDTVG